ncbi:hypothetical protein SAMN06264364_1523 [Quadrisphaera granulorum]|uniref:FAD binding domain-containing protein n=1 Tax=Quadrisphaera granulorum TaxID=317664 RepID=A0A316A7R2_9ACTN|nr:hypothetical protein [Quadrisphaera granulorum]PWJ45777.1 hypothetical protein BXY45_1523 [Quadrisphaera granulorum]SZE99136.1 hypothetical protein SAMN06264364_1523 [Quadrisphaera granulorum]
MSSAFVRGRSTRPGDRSRPPGALLRPHGSHPEQSRRDGLSHAARPKPTRCATIKLRASVVGSEQAVTDLYDDWTQLQEDGVWLVRPDKIVTWRSNHLLEDPAAALEGALRQVLSRGA